MTDVELADVELVIRNATIVFNPADDPYGGIADFDDDDRARGVLQAVGFRAEGCVVTGCKFHPSPRCQQGWIGIRPLEREGIVE